MQPVEKTAWADAALAGWLEMDGWVFPDALRAGGAGLLAGGHAKKFPSLFLEGRKNKRLEMLHFQAFG